MKLSLYIAKRYLFSKKSHQVINIISAVAISGVALATAAMICTMSVFNGFQGVVQEQFTAFDPDIKIVAAKGKTITTDSHEISAVQALSGIDVTSFCVEDRAMIEYGGRQAMVMIKGIDNSFTDLTDFESALYGNGKLLLDDGGNSYAVLGAELLQQLGCGLYFTTPLEVYAPNRNGTPNYTLPARNFKKAKLLSTGLVFILNQPKYDANYIVTSDTFARKLFRRESNEATSMEIKAKKGEDIATLQENIEQILGENYIVQDRYEQQNDVYKVMQVEKLIAYLFLTFILLVACFNIIGSLAMLIIEKRDNMNTLRSMGAEKSTICNVFVIEGCIISTIGAIAGILLGVGLCLLQQEFGIISMGSVDGFVVGSYPVMLKTSDILIVFATVVAIGYLAVWLPVRFLTARYI